MILEISQEEIFGKAKHEVHLSKHQDSITHSDNES